MMIENSGNGDFTQCFPCAKLGLTIFYHINYRQGLNVKTAKRHFFFFNGVQHGFHQKTQELQQQKFGWEPEVRISHISHVKWERFNKETLGCHQKRNKMGGSSLEQTKHVEIAVDFAIVWRFNQQKWVILIYMVSIGFYLSCQLT